jgi:hypothetical protein
MPSAKDWWAPVWKGLVWDGEAKHYRKMRSAIWLFLYFILCADRRTGSLSRKIKTISSHTGFEKRKILRWMEALRKNNYIETSNTGRSLLIQIKNWKRFSTGDKNVTSGATKMTLQNCQKRHFSKKFEWP